MSITLPEVVDTGIFISDMWSYYRKNKHMTMSNDRPVRYYEIDMPLMESGVRYLNDEPIPLNDHMLILAKPGQRKHATLPHKCFFLHLANEKSDIQHILDNLPNSICNINTEDYINIYSEISYYFHSKSDKNTLMIQQLVLKLLHMIIEDAERQERTNSSLHKKRINMQKYIDYIKNNLTEDMSLEALAKMANFSPIYFHTCFKKYTGMTLREFVEEERIKKARVLLSTGELPIEKIAEACGFSSRSYFCVVFKRKTNVTPREYSSSHAKPLM